MPQFGIFILVHIFSAVLPQDDPETDGEFYDILGLDSKTATMEQIRKAYKKKSLTLHPDKVAQRRASTITKEQAAAEYEKVQEAYGVLVNDEKRQRYHALQCSVTRYKFVSKGTLANPGALLENLSKSSFVDKTRLVALCSVLLAILWIQPVLIATKLNHVLEGRGNLQETKWMIILIPWLMLHALIIMFWTGVIFLVPPSARGSVALTVLEQVAWYASIIQLARAWDGTFGEDLQFRNVLIPVYIALILRWIQAVVTLHKIRSDVHRMISSDYLESEILKGKSLEDMTEEERLVLMTEFLLVTVPPDFEPILPDVENDEEAAAGLEAGSTADEELKKNIEEQKVESSPEYEAATEIYNSTFGSLVSSMVFGTVFLILLVLKLDGTIPGANWWTVFTPIWVYLGSLILYYSFACMCGSVSGEEIVLNLNTQQKQQQDDDDDEKKEEKDDVKTGDNEEKSKNKPGENDEPEETIHTAPREQPQTITTAGMSFDNTTLSSSNDPRQDDSVVAPEGSVGKIFNESKEENEVTGNDDVPEDEKEQDEKLRKSPNAEEGQVGPSESNDTDGKKEDGEDDDDDDPIRLDEESFHAFQSAYAEAEQSAMEEQAKASTNCCNSCLQLLILCLVVAKLDKSYDAAQDGDTDDVGFNTYWILFPFLLFCGCLCCICACLIYGASGDLDLNQGEEDEDDEETAGNGSNNNNDEESPTTPIIITPPPPASTSTISASATTDSGPATAAGTLYSNSMANGSNLVSVESDMGGMSSAGVGPSSTGTDTIQSSSIGSVPMPDFESAESTIDDLD